MRIMRLFRTEEAARKAGFKWSVAEGARKWREDDDNNPAEILTDRERALLEALEKYRLAVDAGDTGQIALADDHAEGLLHSLNVE